MTMHRKRYLSVAVVVEPFEQMKRSLLAMQTLLSIVLHRHRPAAAVPVAVVVLSFVSVVLRDFASRSSLAPTQPHDSL